MGLYEKVKEAAKSKGYSINRLEKELGFARSSISKFNKNVPSMEKVKQIANFLDTPIAELTGDDTILTRKDKRDISKALNETLRQLDSQDGLMFDGDALDDETKELLKISLEGAIRSAKIKAKAKFTNDRYKKG